MRELSLSPKLFPYINVWDTISKDSFHRTDAKSESNITVTLKTKKALASFNSGYIP